MPYLTPCMFLTACRSESSPVPVALAAGAAIAAACGAYHIYAITEDGQLLSQDVGASTAGAPSRSAPAAQHCPLVDLIKPVALSEPASMISCGEAHVAVVLVTGGLYLGPVESGQLHPIGMAERYRALPAGLPELCCQSDGLVVRGRQRAGGGLGGDRDQHGGRAVLATTVTPAALTAERAGCSGSCTSAQSFQLPGVKPGESFPSLSCGRSHFGVVSERGKVPAPALCYI